MKWKFWFLILLGLAASYAFYRWQRQQTARPFQAELIAIAPSQIDWFTIAPADDSEWLFKREADHWLLTNGSMTVQTKQQTVSKLLAQCTHFNSDSIRWQPADPKPNPFPKEKARHFRFYRGEQTLDGFTIWPPAEDEPLAHAYLQPNGQQEIYLISEAPRQACFLPFEAFLSKDLLPFPTQNLNYLALLDSANYLIQASRQDSLWTDSSGQTLHIPLLDSLLMPQFLPDSFRYAPLASPPPFEKNWTLLLRNDGPNEVEIQVYYDSLNPQRPFIYRSSLQPELFFREDSSGLFKIIRPLLQLHEK
ncbi:MAG TPA: hypothetical protein ENJ88_11440, partial [Phaeodactylibacter sp.]|nr:hypothetical protein [Phaeodactylibacter sp.]